MRERFSKITKILWSVVIVGAWLFSAWASNGVGVDHGRAEQKKIDEAECAAHPVEVPVVPPAGLSLPPGEWSCSEHGCRPIWKAKQ